MRYLDTGCLLKLYFPEPKTVDVAALVGDDELCFTELHRLESTSGLELKLFRGSATSLQVGSIRAQMAEDVKEGLLVVPVIDWERAWRRAERLSHLHASATGCRSFDTLHCALAEELGLELISTDKRQIALARAMGLAVLVP